MSKINIKINNEIHQVKSGIKLSELAQAVQANTTYPILAAKVNNVLRPLQESVTEDGQVVFLDSKSSIGHRIIERSLVFLLAKVVKELHPDTVLMAEHSIGNGLYCRLSGENRLKASDVEKIELRVQELIDLDLTFERKEMTKQEAIDLFYEMDNETRASLFANNRSKDTTAIYTLDDYQDYMYGYLAPSTSVLKPFSLRFYMPGFLLLTCSRTNPNILQPFKELPKLFNILQESERFSDMQGVHDAGSLNERIRTHRLPELVRISEGFHEKKVVAIADAITRDIDRLKLIMIAGPSSSGKTTFAKRLAVQLMVNGIEPVSVSLDDYFVNRDDTPIDEFGEHDYESVEAIRLEQFNRDLTALIQGEEVMLPHFDFIEGTSIPKTKLKIHADQPIIIEGIHAINDRLTHVIPRSAKYYIYISALTQLNLDSSNRIKTTDARLMRRMIRDARYRGVSPEDTLARWPSVRRGEDQNIFPFQENADVMFNSHLIYEIAVLKPLVEDILSTVGKGSLHWAEASNLLNILDFFEPIIDTTAIPNNSIIREFIGTSCFYDR